MSGFGNGTNPTPVIPAVLGAATLPVTGGLNNAVQIALAVAAGLAAWAVAYMVSAKLNQR